MVERLMDDLGSNRSVAVTLDPKHDCSEEDIPCLQVLQATVRDRKLTIHCFFRSNDISEHTIVICISSLILVCYLLKN